MINKNDMKNLLSSIGHLLSTLVGTTVFLFIISTVLKVLTSQPDVENPSAKQDLNEVQQPSFMEQTIDDNNFGVFIACFLGFIIFMIFINIINNRIYKNKTLKPVEKKGYAYEKHKREEH